MTGRSGSSQHRFHFGQSIHAFRLGQRRRIASRHRAGINDIRLRQLGDEAAGVAAGVFLAAPALGAVADL